MKRETWWPIGLAAVLVLTVLGNIGVFLVAARHGGAEALPGYYQRAVDWDSALAADARSRALRWTLEASLALPQAGTGLLSLALRDSAGTPIAGAEVRVEGFAVARVDAPFDVRLADAGNGRYAVRLPVRRVEWQTFDVTVRRGGDRYGMHLRCLPGQDCHPG